MSLVYWVVFFFKQKTAYEMRISDWSSDVCSSDLPHDVDHRLDRIAEHRPPVVQAEQLYRTVPLGQRGGVNREDSVADLGLDRARALEQRQRRHLLDALDHRQADAAHALAGIAEQQELRRAARTCLEIGRAHV